MPKQSFECVYYNTWHWLTDEKGFEGFESCGLKMTSKTFL